MIELKYLQFTERKVNISGISATAITISDRPASGNHKTVKQIAMHPSGTYVTFQTHENDDVIILPMHQVALAIAKTDNDMKEESAIKEAIKRQEELAEQQAKLETQKENASTEKQTRAKATRQRRAGVPKPRKSN